MTDFEKLVSLHKAISEPSVNPLTKQMKRAEFNQLANEMMPDLIQAVGALQKIRDTAFIPLTKCILLAESSLSALNIPIPECVKNSVPDEKSTDKDTKTTDPAASFRQHLKGIEKGLYYFYENGQSAPGCPLPAISKLFDAIEATTAASMPDVTDRFLTRMKDVLPALKNIARLATEQGWNRVGNDPSDVLKSDIEALVGRAVFEKTAPLKVNVVAELEWQIEKIALSECSNAHVYFDTYARRFSASIDQEFPVWTSPDLHSAALESARKYGYATQEEFEFREPVDSITSAKFSNVARVLFPASFFENTERPKMR